MSSKIEVSRELLERLANPKDCDDGYFDDIAELRALLAAPVVERQPVALITEAPDCIKPEMRPAWIDGWNSARTAQMNTTPPELAELQATIAWLKAENERLKAGQGEPVAFRRFDGEGKFDYWDDEDGKGGSIHFPVEPLYTSQPAPASVVLPERMTREHALELTDYPPESAMYWYNKALDDVQACLDKVKEMNQ